MHLDVKHNDGEESGRSLESELGAPPVSPLGVVADVVIRLHPGRQILGWKGLEGQFNSPDPLWDWTVLLHLFGEFPLDAEGFQSGHSFVRALSI